VDSQAPHVAHDDTDDPSSRPSLQLELRVRDRHVLATFRDTFLRWLADRSGPFARAIGVSETLSLDEVPSSEDPHGMSTLRLTVRWPRTWTPAARSVGAALPAATDPGPPLAHLESVERFVFFPDPPDAAAPLFNKLPAPFHADVFQPPPGVHQLRVSRTLSVRMADNVVETVRAVRGFARAWSSRLGIPGLTIRVPLRGSYPRAWAIGMVGTVAIATGFVAGSIYLARMDRSALDLDLPANPAPAAETVAAPTPVAVATPLNLAVAAGLPRVEPYVQQADPIVRPKASDAMIPTSGSSGIADAEVTTGARRSTAAARPATMLRRSDIVVVRAADGLGASPSASAAANRRVKGTLLVKSDPQGAEVSINGVVHGRTPLMIRDLGAGSRVVRLDLPGYERWSWAVAVVANKRTPVTVKLQPELRRASSLN
jgi:PEGA domain